jgi:hypothetical protein
MPCPDDLRTTRCVAPASPFGPGPGRPCWPAGSWPALKSRASSVWSATVRCRPRPRRDTRWMAPFLIVLETIALALICLVPTLSHAPDRSGARRRYTNRGSGRQSQNAQTQPRPRNARDVTQRHVCAHADMAATRWTHSPGPLPTESPSVVGARRRTQQRWKQTRGCWESRTNQGGFTGSPSRVLSARLSPAGPETMKGPTASGLSQYRHGDSNPGFRRERAAS